MSREEQILRFVQTAAPEILGCHQLANDRAMNFFMSAMAEVKARVLESGMLKARGNAEVMIKNLRKLLPHFKGVDAQSAYQSIPALELSYAQFRELANDLDDLRDPMVTTPEKLIFDKVTILGFDSTRLMATRSHEVLLASNATLLNRFRMWYREYLNLKGEILSNEALDENTERALAKKLFRTNVIGVVMPGFPL